MKKLSFFFQQTLWTADLASLKPDVRRMYLTLRVASMAITSFLKNNCLLYAAALTNITLMSIVPVLAFMLAAAKGLGFHHKVEAMINEHMQEMPAGVADIGLQLMGAVDKVNFATLGIPGLIIFVWTVVATAGKIEKVMNVIWGADNDRSIPQKFREFLPVIIVVPFVMILASATNTIFTSDKVQGLISNHLGPWGTAGLEVGARCSTFLIQTLVLGYMYRFLPNTFVRFRYAYVAAVITTLSWLFVQWIFIKFGIGVGGKQAIYGAFAAVPLFLGWLFISWNILLFGANIAQALQNHGTYDPRGSRGKLPGENLFNISLVLLKDNLIHFQRGDSWTAKDAFERLGLDPVLGRRVVALLRGGNIILATDAIEDGRFVPARDPSQLSLLEVQQAVLGPDPFAFRSEHALPLLSAVDLKNDLQSNYLEKLKATPLSRLTEAKKS